MEDDYLEGCNLEDDKSFYVRWIKYECSLATYHLEYNVLVTPFRNTIEFFVGYNQPGFINRGVLYIKAWFYLHICQKKTPR